MNEEDTIPSRIFFFFSVCFEVINILKILRSVVLVKYYILRSEESRRKQSDKTLDFVFFN